MQKPPGKGPETIWDAFNVGIGIASFVDNVKKGNYKAAAVDAVGVIVDSAATVVPLVPGGAGTIIKVGRGADKVVDTIRGADKVSDVVKGSDKISDAAKFAEKKAGSTSSAVSKKGSKGGQKNSLGGDVEEVEHAKDFDEARTKGFEKAGMTNPDDVKFSKVDPKTGTVVEFKGKSGAKVAYDYPHASPGPGHDKPHVGYQNAGKRGDGGTKRGNITYSGPQHPSRSPIKGEGVVEPH